MKNLAYAFCFLLLGCGGSEPLSSNQPLIADAGSGVDGALPPTCSVSAGAVHGLGDCCSEWVPCAPDLTCVGGDTAPGSVGTCAETTKPTSCSISAASYDQTCSQDSDCVAVFQTMTCNDMCDCPNAAVSESAAAQYKQDLASRVHVANVCACATETPRCIDSVCALPGN